MISNIKYLIIFFLDLREIDPFLGPFQYNEEPTKYWPKLSGFITPALLDRILPQGWVLTSQTGSTTDEGNTIAHTSKELLKFTKIDLKHSWPTGATGRELTIAARDKSWLLEHVANDMLGGKFEEILGEFQLGFILLLYLSNFSGFEVWKTMIHLFCDCYNALFAHEDVFIGFIGMFVFSDGGGRGRRNFWF